MTITIELPANVEAWLAGRAARQGTTPAAEAAAVLARAAGKTLAEIFGPLSEEFARGGTTEDEFDALVERARQAVWDEEQRGRP